MINVTVEAAFDGSTWQTPIADITFTNVTSYVSYGAGVTISRGRSSQTDDTRAGTCQFTLIDPDRRFDPENTAGPYYGFLNPGVPVRVSASVSADTSELSWDADGLLWGSDTLVWGGSASYPRFYGFVEEWPQGYEDPADRRVMVQIDATDALGMLAMQRQNSVLYNEILSDTPLAFWPLNEGGGARMLDASGNRLHGVYSPGTANLDTTIDLESGHRLPALDFDGDHSGRVRDYSAYTGSGDASVEMLFVWRGESDPGFTFVIPFRQGGGNVDDHISINLGSDGFSSTFRRQLLGRFRWLGLNYTVTPVEFLEYDTPYYVVLDTISGIQRLHVNGTTYTQTVVGGSGGDAFIGTTIGQGAVDVSQRDFEGPIAFVALYDKALSATRRAAHYSAATAPLDGQTTDERISYLLDQAGISTLDVNLSSGFTPLGPADHEGQFTLDLIRRIEKTEQGRFFIAKDGTYTFHSRYHGQLVASSSSATFSDDGANSPYSEVEVVRARRFVFNHVSVATDSLAELSAADDTSIAAYGERDFQIDAPLLASTTQQQSLAEYVLAVHKDPQPRVFGLSVPVARDVETLGPIVWALELGDRVAFERTPLGTGDALSWDQTIEGYTERFNTRSWTWTPNLSPAEPKTFATWGGSGSAHQWGTALWAY